MTVIDVSVSGIPDEDVSQEWTSEGFNDTMMVLVKPFEGMDLDSLPRFKCERRYKHACEWDRRYHYLVKWIEEEDKEKKIKNFFKEKGFSNIYIYGYGPIGKLLYDLLKKMDIFQLQVMDKNADKIQELSVIKFGENIDESNTSCMIITVLDLGIKEELDTKYRNVCKYFADNIF